MPTITAMMPVTHVCVLLHVSRKVLMRRLEHHQLEVVRVGARIVIPAETFLKLKHLCTEVYKPRQRKPKNDIRKDNLVFDFGGGHEGDRRVRRD